MHCTYPYLSVYSVEKNRKPHYRKPIYSKQNLQRKWQLQARTVVRRSSGVDDVDKPIESAAKLSDRRL